MMKTGATAMLAVATLSGSATAQAVAAEDTCGVLYAHCVGPEAGDNGPCCAPLTCVQKNAQYAQCLKAGQPAPLGWMGNILTFPESPSAPVASTPVAPAPVAATPVVATDADAGMDYEDMMGEMGEGPVMDAEDMVEMGLAPPGMDAEDLEEMGMVTSMEDAEEMEDYLMANAADEEQMGATPQVMIENPEVIGAVPPADPVVPAAPVATTTGTVEVGEVSYMAFINRDYIPDGQNLVDVMDIMPQSVGAMKVASPQVCEDLCTVTAGCNAASYYLDGSKYPSGNNCWLKTLADSCELPADASTDTNAVLLLQINDTCEDLFAAAAGPVAANAMGPMAVADAPISEMLDAASPRGIDLGDLAQAPVAPPANEPFAPGSTTRALGDAPSVPIGTPSAVANTNGAVSVRGAMIAMAVAGAAAFF